MKVWNKQDINVALGDKLLGCLVGGAIGDAVGSFYEGKKDIQTIEFECFNGITDDTQLTLATCESIIITGGVNAEDIAKRMLVWYNGGKLRGLGSSTLKALRDLQVGAHWALAGRSGEYGAGNGAAMRIAPLAFALDIDRERTLIRDVCNITHKNDEAYVGCLAILYALQYVMSEKVMGDHGLIDHIIPRLPDTSVRDNLIKLRENSLTSIREAAKLVGTSGHVVQSVPFSIFAAGKINEASFEDIISEVILSGGDTDTNASLTGQIIGAHLGLTNFSDEAKATYNTINESEYILQVGFEVMKVLSSR